MFTLSAHANLVESFNNVTVNTNGSSISKVQVNVHVVSEHSFANADEKMAVREIIAITLSAYNAKELVVFGAIENVKHELLKKLSENKRLASVSITNVYVTDLVVSKTGNSPTKAVFYDKRKLIDGLER